MKILLPVDGSEPALDAVRHALPLAREGLTTGFLLATVQESAFWYVRLLPPTAEVLERISGAVGAQALEKAEALLHAAGVSLEREVGAGEVVSLLLDVVRRHSCDTAIVMGARGMGMLRSALLGSISLGVVQNGAVPVTVVKHSPPLAASAA